MANRRTRFWNTKRAWAAVLLSMTISAGALVVQRDPAPRTERPPSSPRPVTHERRADETTSHAKGRDAMSRDVEADLAHAPERLLARLEQSDLGERMSAIELMRGREEAVVLQALGRTLTDPDPDVRRVAFRAVVDMALTGGEAPEPTSLLQQALSDPDARVRIDALDALAQRGEEGLAAIREAAADPSEEVGEYAQHCSRGGGPTDGRHGGSA